MSNIQKLTEWKKKRARDLIAKITKAKKENPNVLIKCYGENADETHDLEADFNSFEGKTIEKKVESLIVDINNFNMKKISIVIFDNDPKEIKINQEGQIII